MKKDLKYLLFEEENKKLYKTYQKLFEDSENQNDEEASQATQKILGSLTAAGEEMFYVFAIPALGVPIKEENMTFHNEIFGTSLTNQGEESERSNVHTKLVRIPWLTFKNEKEFESFKKKLKTKINAGEGGEGSKVPGLQSLYSVQKSRRSTTSKDKEIENKDSRLENVQPIDFNKIRIGSSRLAKLLNSRLGGIEKSIENINKIEDEDKKEIEVSKLEKNPLGVLSKQKIRQLINVDIPMSGDSQVTVSINPISGLPNKPLEDGFKPVDYRIFEEIQMMLFVLQTDEEIEEEEEKEEEGKEADSESIEPSSSEDTGSGDAGSVDDASESVFYFHKKTLSENLSLLENTGSNIMSTKTAYIPRVAIQKDISKEKELKDNLAPKIKYSAEQKKVVKILSDLNLVSLDSSLLGVWGESYKEKFKLSDSIKDKNIIKANKKIKKLLGDEEYNFEDDDTTKFIFNRESEIVDYKDLKKQARREFRNYYYTILSTIKSEDGENFISGAKKYLTDISGAVDKKKSKGKEKHGKWSSRSRMAVGGTIGYNLLADGGFGYVYNSIIGTGVKGAFWGALGPAGGLIGIPIFAVLFKQFKLEKKALRAVGKTNLFQTFFTGKEIRKFSKSLLEISAKAKDINENDLPDMYKFKRIWKNSSLNEEADLKANYVIDFNSIDNILKKNKSLYHREAAITLSQDSEKESSAGIVRGRKKYDYEQIEALKNQTRSILPAILKELFGVTVKGEVLSKKEKDLNKEITSLKILDKQIKEKSEETIDQIPFSMGKKEVNTGVHFTSFLYSLSKEASMLKDFKKFTLRCALLNNKDKKLLFKIFDIDRRYNWPDPELSELFGQVINQMHKSGYEPQHNNSKLVILYYFFKHINNNFCKAFIQKISLSYDPIIERTSQQNLERHSSKGKSSIVCFQGEFNSIVNNSVSILNNISLKDYSRLNLQNPVTYTSSTSESINKRVINRVISSDVYDCLSSTLYVLLDNKEQNINVQNQNYDLSNENIDGISWVRGTLKDFKDENKSYDKSIYLSAEGNQKIYMNKAYKVVYSLFYRNLIEIARKFSKDVLDVKELFNPEKPVEEVVIFPGYKLFPQPPNKKIPKKIRSLSGDRDNPLWIKYNETVEKIKAKNKEIETEHTENKKEAAIKYKEELKKYDREIKVFNSNLSKIEIQKKFLERVDFDIKLFILLVVASSTPGGFREKAEYVNNFFANNVTKESKVKALMLVDSKKSFVANIKPIVSDGYIYNKKLAFLID